MAQRIESLGGEVVEFPTIEIRPPESYGPLDQAINQIESYDWLIFTSVNGVERFLNRFEKLGKNLANLAGIEVGAIGPETARRLTAAQIEPTLVPKQYQAEGILDELISETVLGKRILIPRAAKARDILPETLRRWGARVDVVEAYQTVLPQVDVSALCRLLREGTIDMITFTSSSTATNFSVMLRDQDLPRLLSRAVIACIGPITKKTVEDLGMRPEIVSEEFTIPGLVRAMVDYFSRTANERPAGR
ncbi:MAG TPA: uroporphyrinogen-III synthase [Candidatus Binatia bacterium]|nr:uroporphyrinogen-III synthase [Candidatus Binatia bacterium]